MPNIRRKNRQGTAALQTSLVGRLKGTRPAHLLALGRVSHKYDIESSRTAVEELAGQTHSSLPEAKLPEGAC